MAYNPDRIGEGFDALSKFFVADRTLGDTLTRVSELACEVSGADMAGITLMFEAKARTGVFTDPDAVEIDQAQYDSDDGPCLDAFRFGETYRVDAIELDFRWPEFSAMAAEYGIRCSLSLPILARGESLGALNLYSRRPGTFDDQPGEALESFVRQAAIVLVNARVYWDSRQLTEDLRQAMVSRSTIDQAIGIVMAAGGRTPDEVFQLLVRASQRENRKLRDIAGEIVAGAMSRAPYVSGNGNGKDTHPGDARFGSELA